MTPRIFEIDGMSSGYYEIVKAVYNDGAQTSPRGLRTRELLDAVIFIEDPFDALPVAAGRELNISIAAVEALQLIGGFSQPDLNLRASRNFAQFTEPDGSFWGAYGNRIGDQVRHVVRKLHDDPDTRQAVITLWDPRLDNQPGHRDYPCTILHAYRIRNGRLDASVVMRSNDVILGLAYDVFQFTQLQIAIAYALDVNVGTYTHHAVSLHLYERDVDRVAALHAGLGSPHASIGRRGISFLEIQDRAMSIANREEPDDATAEELWYLETIRGLYDKA